MADLPEINEWPEGIYQLETSDPVLGGPDGIDNLQAKQLASRTRWLRAQVALLGEGKQPMDATLTALADLILEGDKLIYATGVDSFATTALSSYIRSLLGDVDAAAARATLGAAPLVSPALSGVPTAPTAATGSNSSQVASTGFVQDAIAKYSSVTSVSANTLLTAANRGLVLIDSGAASLTITLPASNPALGVTDYIIGRTDNTGNRLVIQAGGADKIKFHTHLRAAGYPFFVLMGAGDWWHLRSDSAGNWWPIGRFDSTPLGRPVFETTMALSPGGWGLYHGLIYNRADWPWTWDHAQASGMLTTEAARTGKEGCWTSGDGALTFRSPEGRAEFIRFLDESRGIDTGRVAGSSQADELKSHTHGYGADANLPVGSGNTVLQAGTSKPTSATGGTETRPRNIANPGRIKLI